MTDTKTYGLHLTWGPGMTESHIQYRHPCISIDITVCIRTVSCGIATGHSKICS